MHIGSHILPNQVILAPMAGVTDLPYRNVCRQRGAGAAVAEMLTSDHNLWDKRKSVFRRVQASESGLRWVQIVGNDPQQMALAARECEVQGANIVDINMGCPAKKVCRKAAGSALLQDEKLVGQILHAVVAAVSIPVTLKIRTGWNTDNKNAVNIARIAEQCGVAALSIHGRTRACKYDTAAEYETAAAVKQAITIPLIVNGDITTPAKAAQVLAFTGADGIMIGRAALGNPWLFHQIDQYINHNRIVAAPSLDDIHACIARHVRDLHAFYGPYLGVRMARKHMCWYEEQFPQLFSKEQLFSKDQLFSSQEQFSANPSFRQRFNKLEEGEQQLALIHDFFTRIVSVAA